MEDTNTFGGSLSAALVKQVARAVGFDACGIAEARPLAEEDFGLDTWLALGCHADMRYMAEHRDLRHDPRLLVPGARSVVSLLLGYKPSQRLSATPRIAQYAYGEDYHERVKRLLYQLIAAVREVRPDFDARPFVDTAPISDKLWAARAGLGWIGRNTLLVNPELGSYCFIGELVTSAAFDHYDTPMPNGCGTCRRCLAACPNHALVDDDGTSVDNPRTHLSAPRCASYHTIENRSAQLPADIKLFGYAFGCDCCQLVCPYNLAAAVRYPLTADRRAALESLPEADEPTFRHFAKHSALNRVKYPQWQRNVNKSEQK